MYTATQLQSTPAPSLTSGLGRIRATPAAANSALHLTLIGNPATGATPLPLATGLPSSFTLATLARQHRSREIARLLAAALAAGTSLAQRLLARWHRAQLQRDTYRTLNELDNRTLRDLGFDRSEILSVAAEIAGTAESTRVARG